MTRQKRWILRGITLLLAGILTAFAVGCEKNGSSESSGGVNVYRTPVPTPPELVGQLTLSTYRTADNDTSAFMFIQDYILEYPGVEILNDNTMTYDEYFATLDARVESGEIGDVFLVDSDRLATYVEKGYVMNLTPYLDGLIEYVSGDYNRLYPDLIFYPAAYQASLYQGQMYMVPTEYENKAVLLNLDLLREAGLSVPADSWTWDDVLDYAVALKESGCAFPISMDYTDFSVWGAFAMSRGGELFRTVDEKTGETSLNLTDPKVVQGLEFLAEEFIAKGYIAEKKPAEISEEEISQYGMVIISHSDLDAWYDALHGVKQEGSDTTEPAFDWEFAHFPRFSETAADEEVKTYHNIGVKTLGLAVRVRDYGDGDDVDVQMEDQIRAQLALYAMIEEASVHLAGTSGYRVPAMMAANARRFWRDYPRAGKNTSVFSLYSDADFNGTLSGYMVLDAANEIGNAMGDAIEQYAASPDTGRMDELLQQIQNHANANWE